MAKSWGTPTWTFFHTFAENIDEEFYLHNRDTIMIFIKSICLNLPCQECSHHSSKYNKFHLTRNNVSDKNGLKKYFLDFHNNVNKRKNKSIFSVKDLDKYKNYKFSLAYLNFKNQYISNHGMNRGFMNTLQRKNIIKNLESFIVKNKTKFNWL